MRINDVTARVIEDHSMIRCLTPRGTVADTVLRCVAVDHQQTIPVVHSDFVSTATSMDCGNGLCGIEDNKTVIAPTK